MTTPARQIIDKDSKDVKGAFLIGGVPYYVPFPVINYKDEERGYSFENSRDLRANYGIREDPTGNGIDCVVLHWDVCESARDCFRVLCQRKISGHILIDSDGTVYQPLDLIKMSYHAIGCNNNSIGIYIQNPVDPSKNISGQHRNRTESRETGTTDSKYLHLDFTEEQKEVTVKVCDILCQIFPNIPKILPPLSDDGLITNATLPKEERIGIIGHYNAHFGNLGPGDSLWVEFYKANFPIKNYKPEVKRKRKFWQRLKRILNCY